MGRKDHGPFRSQGVNEVPEPDPLPGVQSGGGLVQYEKLRVVNHGLGDANPLEHPAGELTHFLARRVLQTHQLQQALDALLRLPAGDALEGGGIAQELPGAVVWVVPELLRQVAQQAPIGLVQSMNILAVPQYLAGGREQQGGEHLDEGGLSRSVGGQQPENSRGEGEGDILQCGKTAVFFGDVFNAEHIIFLLLGVGAGWYAAGTGRRPARPRPADRIRRWGPPAGNGRAPPRRAGGRPAETRGPG